VDLYYCQIEYQAESEGAAAANGSAESDDLISGCNGYSWSRIIED
jgi:hypothetical protein